jgi:hypothetical protein
MTTKKLLGIALIPIAILLLLWLFTQAFHMLSAASDTSVILGALLLGACFVLIILLLKITRKLFF